MLYVIYGKQPNTENEICLAIVPTPEELPGIISSLTEKECIITEMKCYSKPKSNLEEHKERKWFLNISPAF